jgi:hypothetical protein
MSSEVIRIGLDHDDVLVQFIPGFVAWSHKRYDTSPRMSDYMDDWARWWGVPVEEAITRRSTFWESGVALDFPVVPRAKETLRRLSDYGLHGCEVEMFILTSRPEVARFVTQMSVELHFPDFIRPDDIFFAGFFDGPITEESYRRTKGHIFKEKGAHVAVDDAPSHVNDAGELGIPLPIHLDYYRRHGRPGLHPAAQSVTDWGQALDCMETLELAS